jgi:hypothetical protein
MEELAKRKKKSEFAGIGCVYQAIGLLCPIIFSFLTAVVIGTEEGITVGFLIGLFLMLILLLYGSRKSIKWICGNCRNPIADKSVNVCPVCKAKFEHDSRSAGQLSVDY